MGATSPQEGDITCIRSQTVMTHVHMRKLENYVVLIDHVAYQCSKRKKLLIAIIKEKCVCLCRYILLVCSGNKDGLK